ncbi:MAG: hypothetical protein E4G96_04615 [Chrysiogenales bacterium]|nr:MAG: hypothetical protein E4G96_04615 [Chrysiogenales bacterium]
MQPNLDNVKKKIQENRDLVDRITMKVPGFKGYVEKAEINDADRIVRNLLGERVRVFKSDVNAAIADFEKKGERGHHADLDSLGPRMETVIKKCLHSDFGSTSSLSGAAVSEEDRNRLLEYDWRLISSLDELEKGVGELCAAAPGAMAPAIERVGALLRDFEKGFDERKHVLLEVI